MDKSSRVFQPYALWLAGLLGLLIIVGDITWTILSFARAKRTGESKLKFYAPAAL